MWWRKYGNGRLVSADADAAESKAAMMPKSKEPQ
jgi:hypothetical protein